MQQYNLIDSAAAAHEENHRRLAGARTTIVLALLAFALLLTLIPLFFALQWVRDDVRRLEEHLTGVRAQIEMANLPTAEMTELQAEIVRIQELVEALESVSVPSGLHWPDVIPAVERYDRNRITLLSVAQTAVGIRVTGKAADNEAVVQYSESLFNTGRFDDVSVQNMTVTAGAATGAGVATTAAESETRPAHPVEFVLDLIPELPQS